MNWIGAAHADSTTTKTAWRRAFAGGTPIGDERALVGELFLPLVTATRR